MPNTNQLIQTLGQRQSPKLSKEALSGLDPKLQLGVAQQRQKQEQQMTDRIDTVINNKLKKKRVDLQERKAEALLSYREKQKEKTQFEIDKLERQEEMMDSYDRSVMTTAGEMPLKRAAFLNKAGMNVKLAKPQMLGNDFFQNEDGTVSAALMWPTGETEVKKFDDLEGAEQFAERTEIQRGPGRKTTLREQAQQAADASDVEFVGSAVDKWTNQNPIRAGALTLSKDEAGSEAIQVQKDLVEDIKRSIAVNRPQEEEIVVRHGPKGPGYYTTKGVYINKLPSQVDPEVVIDTKEESKSEKSKYSSPEEVRKAVGNGTISRDEGVSILKKNWPERFK